MFHSPILFHPCTHLSVFRESFETQRREKSKEPMKRSLVLSTLLLLLLSHFFVLILQRPFSTRRMFPTSMESVNSSALTVVEDRGKWVRNWRERMQVCNESRHTSRPCIIDLLYHPIATKCSSPAFTYVQEFGNTMDLIGRRKTKAKSCSQALRHSVCEWNEEGKIWDEFERVYFRNFFLLFSSYLCCKIMILEFIIMFLKNVNKNCTNSPTSYQPNLT